MNKEYIDYTTYKTEPNQDFLLDSAALLYLINNIRTPAFNQMAGLLGVTVMPDDVAATEGNGMMNVITAEASRRGYQDQFNDILNKGSIGGVDPETPNQKIARWQKMKKAANGYVNDTGNAPGVPIVDSSGQIASGNSPVDKILGTLSGLGKSFINSSVEYKVIAGAITVGVGFLSYKMIKAKSFKFWKKK